MNALHIASCTNETSALIARSHALSPALFTRIVETACPRSVMLAATCEATAIHRLVAAGAWTDAALALVRLELPLWRVRRLIWDDGDWHCALSRHWTFPNWLDDAAEAHHSILALAILGALVEARRRPESAEIASQKPAGSDLHTTTICCENFA